MELTMVAGPNGVAVVQPVGRLDLLSASELRQTLIDAVAAGKHRLVVDLAGVPFVDSSGLAALISGLKAARLAGGDLRIARPGQQARTVFELTRLDRVLPGYSSVEEAAAGY